MLYGWLAGTSSTGGLPAIYNYYRDERPDWMQQLQQRVLSRETKFRHIQVKHGSCYYRPGLLFDVSLLRSVEHVYQDKIQKSRYILGDWEKIILIGLN